METMQRAAGVFLVVVAVIVVAQAIIPGGRHDLWTYLNPLMAVSIVAVLAVSAWSRQRASGGGEASAIGGLTESRIVFYVGVFVAYLFFMNWIRELDVGEGHSWVWLVLNGGIPVLNVWAAARLWKAGRE